MTSSNIHSTVNITSASSVTAPPLPSVFELLAQERLAELIRPCLRQVLKFLLEICPLSTLFRTLYEYKDEFILLIECLVQWLYLHSHSALIGEHFYGLRRTANHRLRSLIFSVFVPYVQVKLEALQERLRTDSNRRGAAFHTLARLLPKIQTFIEGVNWLYRLGYAFGRTEYYSPALQLAGVKLTYAKEPSPTAPPSSTSGRLFGIVSQVMSSGLFLMQFADWWNSTHGGKPKSSIEKVVPPLPRRLGTGQTIGKRQCPLCRQPCTAPTALRGSGYVYCYTCINDYLSRYQRCPATHQPATSDQLTRIF